MDNIFFTTTWWFWLFILGIVSIPISFSLFKKFFDGGYGLTKTISILFTSYLVFFLSTLQIIPFTRVTIIAIIATYAAFNLWLYFKNKANLKKTLSRNIKLILFEEFLFFAGLSFWAYVRSHQPDINGLEKFMDFGFVNSILRSTHLPPTDMWAAGLPINYYWYGHYTTAFLTKLTNIPSGTTYNLMLATILGLSLTSTFSLVSSLILNIKRVGRAAVVVGGLTSAILLNFAGNFHTPFYVIKNGVEKYWYPDATRFIGYNPDIADKTIHEFPIYSYVVSDLHAHLLNLPFVLLFLSVLYVFIASKNKQPQTLRLWLSQSLNKKVMFRNTPKNILFFLGFLLGVMFMTNAWDFANYLLVTGFVLLFAKLNKFKSEKLFDYFLDIAGNILTITIVAGITTLPFLLNFESIAQGVDITHTKTPLWQLAILWGFPALLTVLFITRLFIHKSPKKSGTFITALLAASWVLIFIPEFVYVKDIYAASHYRANTMFKLTYQAYVMFYLSSGYVAINLIQVVKSYLSKIVIIFIFSTAFTVVLYYPFLAIKSYYGEIFDKTDVAKSLSGDEWLSEKYPDTLAVINWFKNNVSDQSIILEAPGDSYTDYNAISSYTGLPTVSGWYVHEWLWRGSSDFPSGRVNDITQIYNSEDVALTKGLLEKYSVRYVVVGSFEREKFPGLKDEKFLELGKLVFSSGLSKIYQVN